MIETVYPRWRHTVLLQVGIVEFDHADAAIGGRRLKRAGVRSTTRHRPTDEIQRFARGAARNHLIAPIRERANGLDLGPSLQIRTRFVVWSPPVPGPIPVWTVEKGVLREALG
jgi:hypothetical protein